MRSCCQFGYSLPPKLCGRDHPPNPQPQLTPFTCQSVVLDVLFLVKRICLLSFATLKNLTSSDTQAYIKSSKSACPADDAKIPQKTHDLDNTLEAKPDITETQANNYLLPQAPSVRARFTNVDFVCVSDAAQLGRSLDCVDAKLERSGDS